MKKLITLILLSTMLVACGQTTTEQPEMSDSETFVEAWNGAANEARTVILFDETSGKTILFHLINEEAEVTEGCEENAAAILEANNQLITSVSELFANATLETIEDGDKLFSSLVYKFEVSDPEILLDPTAVTFIVYEDLHMEVTNHEVVTYYSLSQEDFDALKVIGDTYLEALYAQDSACLVQNFSK